MLGFLDLVSVGWWLEYWGALGVSVGDVWLTFSGAL
jgi:hypothetical protein